MLKTEVIGRFLTKNTHADLAKLYNHDMECQVIVAQDGGEETGGEYAGRKWRGYTDGSETWKSFRIPYKAYDEPEYTDHELKWNIQSHAEAIGMTGWDWVNRCSRWVAFDFDAITGHSDRHTRKLSNSELLTIQESAITVPWITVRKSTSGRGLHLYVYLDCVPTNNHTEHAALARSILGKITAFTGMDFQSRVDICGGNMWVWHRKMIGTRGLELVKEGEVLYDPPANWIDHMQVVKGSSKRSRVRGIESKHVTSFEELTNGRPNIRLEDEHQKLIKWMDENLDYWGWWDAERHLLVTHTLLLKKAHDALNMVGVFETNSEGNNLAEQNCFCFPLRKGSWMVRRFSVGVEEHSSWHQDPNGWTRCYFNRLPDLRTAAMTYGAVEDPKGGYYFPGGTEAIGAGLLLGADIKINPADHNRPVHIKLHKDGQRIVVQVPKTNQDDPKRFQGWLQETKNWVKVYNSSGSEQESETDQINYDDTVRHVVTSSRVNAGWRLKIDDEWHDEPENNIKNALSALGVSSKDMKFVLGDCIMRPWRLDVRPFQEEYPGGRVWNRNAPQFKVIPTQSDTFSHPTWTAVLNNLGDTLTPFLQSEPWCKANGVLTGGDYLKCWVAAMFQYPMEKLPFLFFYGEQNIGKSLFHEALSLLFSPGYMEGNKALTNAGDFTGELEGAILCYVEELDLRKNKTAYERIKQWVTGQEMMIHTKRQTPYLSPNATHWVHVAQSLAHCALFEGDSRITTILVNPLKKHIPKRELLPMLEKEAPDFLGAMLKLEIVPADNRLFIPIIETGEKESAMESSLDAVGLFIKEKCYLVPGATISLADFYDEFHRWLDPSDRHAWSSKQKVSQKMPSTIPKGRLPKDGNWYWGNVSFSDCEASEKLLLHNGYLVKEGEMA